MRLSKDLVDDGQDSVRFVDITHIRDKARLSFSLSRTTRTYRRSKINMEGRDGGVERRALRCGEGSLVRLQLWGDGN